MKTIEHEERIQTVCLLFLSAIGIGVALFFLKPVLIPFVLAIFFTYCLLPAIDLMRRHLRAPRYVAMIATFLLGCILLALIGVLIAASVGQMSTHAEVYQTQFMQLLDKFMAAIPLERFGVQPADLTTSLLNNLENVVGRVVSGTISSIMSVISNGLLVLIFLLFLLIGRTAGEETTRGILGEIEMRIKRFILTKVLVSVLTGILVGAVLAILGVPFAFVFGVLAFLFNFIPSIGSVIATLIPLPVILLNPELGMTAKILALAIPGIIQFSVGNFIEPKLMGRSLDLHPIVILMSLIFFGIIWGIIGMFLATPITAVIKIIFEKIEITKPVAEILAGRMSALMAETGDVAASP